MPGIPDDTLAQVRAASDLVDVVGDRVRLKKQGRRFVGLCPFHNEKTPSFSVDPNEGLYYCFGCLDEDEPVWTARGLIRIGDVLAGDTVLGIDGTPERVVDVWAKQATVRELSLAAVRRDPLRLTSDHVCMVVPRDEAVTAVPMLYEQTDRGIRYQSRKQRYGPPRAVGAHPQLARDVEVGDYVLFPVIPDGDRSDESLDVTPPRALPVPALAGAAPSPWPRRKGPAPVRVQSMPVNKRTARLYGLWLAEGSTYRGGVRWSFHHKEDHLAQFVVDTLRDEFGLDASIHVRPERSQREVTCSNTHLSRLMPRFFGRGATGKRIPWCALKWTRSVQRALVEGYLDGDGTRLGPEQATATSVSESLIRGLFAVSIQCGQVVSMGRDTRVTTAENPTWRLTKRCQASRDGFFHPADGQMAFWMRVAGNEATGQERRVIDIETTGTHTFTTKLGAVHNCRRGGDVFKFVEEVEGVGFLDAVRLLADRAGIPIEESGGGPESDRRASLHAALRFAAGFYFGQLKTEAGARGLAYLQGRGFTKETVVAFGIGVAPPGWDALATAATREGFKPDVLEAVGLAKTRDSGGSYDVFRDRLMFPILSPIGKVLGFGGRILPDTEQGSADYTPAKYINTPETEVYRKSRVLYGLKQSKRTIRSEEEAIVVEGYADVVSLHQTGITNVVAASGTALTAQQMDLLAQTARSVVLLFDADAAGQSAARKGVDVALDAGLSPYAVTLPDGADPDSFVRQFGAEAFRRYLAEERRDFVTFLVEAARRSGELDTPEGKSAAAQTLIGAIRRVRDSIQANEYLRNAAEALGVYESDLRREYDRAEGRSERRGSGPRRVDLAPEPRIPDVPEPAVVVVRPDEEQLIALMLSHGAVMVEHILTRMGVEEFTEGAPRETIAALIAQYQAGSVDSGPFVRGDHGEAVRALATQALAERYETSERYEDKGLKRPSRDDPHAVANSSMQLLKLARVQEAIEAAARRQQDLEQHGSDASEAMREIMALHDLRRQIEHGDFLEWNEP